MQKAVKHLARTASLLACMVLCGAALANDANSQPMLSLVPWPAHVDIESGAFLVKDGTPIVVADHDPATKRTADYLSDLLKRTRGLSLPVTETSGKLPVNAIVLRQD